MSRREGDLNKRGRRDKTDAAREGRKCPRV